MTRPPVATFACPPWTTRIVATDRIEGAWLAVGAGSDAANERVANLEPPVGVGCRMDSETKLLSEVVKLCSQSLRRIEAAGTANFTRNHSAIIQTKLWSSTSMTYLTTMTNAGIFGLMTNQATKEQEPGLLITLRLSHEDTERFEKHRKRIEKSVPRGAQLKTPDIARILLTSGMDTEERRK
jgi:hypothetical protein